MLAEMMSLTASDKDDVADVSGRMFSIFCWNVEASVGMAKSAATLKVNASEAETAVPDEEISEERRGLMEYTDERELAVLLRATDGGEERYIESKGEEGKRLERGRNEGLSWQSWREG